VPNSRSFPILHPSETQTSLSKNPRPTRRRFLTMTVIHTQRTGSRNGPKQSPWFIFFCEKNKSRHFSCCVLRSTVGPDKPAAQPQQPGRPFFAAPVQKGGDPDKVFPFKTSWFCALRESETAVVTDDENCLLGYWRRKLPWSKWLAKGPGGPIGPRPFGRRPLRLSGPQICGRTCSPPGVNT